MSYCSTACATVRLQVSHHCMDQFRFDVWSFKGICHSENEHEHTFPAIFLFGSQALEERTRINNKVVWSQWKLSFFTSNRDLSAVHEALTVGRTGPLWVLSVIKFVRACSLAHRTIWKIQSLVAVALTGLRYGEFKCNGERRRQGNEW